MNLEWLEETFLFILPSKVFGRAKESDNFFRFVFTSGSPISDLYTHRGKGQKKKKILLCCSRLSLIDPCIKLVSPKPKREKFMVSRSETYKRTYSLQRLIYAPFFQSVLPAFVLEQLERLQQLIKAYDYWRKVRMPNAWNKYRSQRPFLL